jgi:hypothetical protein
MEPGLDEIGPRGDRESSSSEAERVPALGVQVHFDRYAGVFKRNIVHERMVDIVDVIVFGL